MMREISISEIEGIRIGQVENAEAGTGCTVFICEDGMRAGLDVCGGGPASRESQLLNPLMSAQMIHAIVLAGGSAYGLGTADGVMSCLEERGIGYDTGYALVPLVAQADIYDLSVGDPAFRPDAAMGYKAARIHSRSRWTQILRRNEQMTHETNARISHRSGYNCAQAVMVTFSDELGVTPIAAMKLAPVPRSAGGKCGAYLAGLALLNELKPEAMGEYEQAFLRENGSTECKRLRISGIPCNDLVGSAARLVEELIQ